MTAKLICGCGYLGERVANRWIAAGKDVFATTRRPEHAEQLARRGIRPVVVDITRPFALPDDLLPIDTVLFAVGFDRTAGQAIHEVYVEGMRNLLRTLPPHVRKVIYISTTGVYGPCDGEWIDERTPCHPTRPGAQASLAAEQLLTEHTIVPHRVILRLAGIYGPDRIPKLDAVRRGEPIEVSPTGYLNLIHVADAVEVVLAADQSTAPPAVLNVSDGYPVARAEFYRELARLLSAPEPHFVDPQPNDARHLRGTSDKRISNLKLQHELRVQLRFPSYREGLADIVQDRMLGNASSK